MPVSPGRTSHLARFAFRGPYVKVFELRSLGGVFGTHFVEWSWDAGLVVYAVIGCGVNLVGRWVLCVMQMALIRSKAWCRMCSCNPATSS